MRLALVVSTPLERGDLVIAADLALAARRRHLDVSVFFMDAGVAALAARPALADELADAGCELVACASSAEARELSAASLPQVVFGSQDDHAAMVHKAERVVAFT